jgi:hypothetical protein
MFPLKYRPFAQRRIAHTLPSQQARASQPPLVVRTEVLPKATATEIAVLQERDPATRPLKALLTTGDCPTYQPPQHGVATAPTQPQSNAAPTFEALLHRRVRCATKPFPTKQHPFHSMGLCPLRGTPTTSLPLTKQPRQSEGTQASKTVQLSVEQPGLAIPLPARRAIDCSTTHSAPASAYNTRLMVEVRNQIPRVSARGAVRSTGCEGEPCNCLEHHGPLVGTGC